MTWEYAEIVLEQAENPISVLNRMGNASWELVAVNYFEFDRSCTNYQSNRYIFKRPKITRSVVPIV